MPTWRRNDWSSQLDGARAPSLSRRRALGLAAAGTGVLASGVIGQAALAPAPASADTGTPWGPPYSGYLASSTLTVASSTVTIDLTVADHWDLTLTQNTSLVLANTPATTVPVWIVVRTHQDTVGAHRMQFFPGTIWPIGVVPSLSTEPLSQDTFSFFVLNGIISGYIVGEAEA